MIMKGKKGLIVGLANNKSIAYGIAKACAEQGAEMGFTYLNDALKKRVEPIAAEFGSDKVYKLDVGDEADMDAICSLVEKDFGKIDFLVHSVAFAPKEALTEPFMKTSKSAFAIAMDVSVYSLIDLTNRLTPVLTEDASILTLSYLGGPKYVVNYNVMGVAKAALEATVRYMAVDMGGVGRRVNAISAGPIRTLAAAGVSRFKTMHSEFAKLAPLQRNVTIEDVGNTAVYLCSNLAAGVTGEVHYVDSGFNVVGLASASGE